MLTSELIGWKARLDALPLAVCVCDSRWKVVLANTEAAAYFDRPAPTLLIGVPIYELWPERRRAEVRAGLETFERNRLGELQTINLPERSSKFSEQSIKVSATSIREHDLVYWQLAFEKRVSFQGKRACGLELFDSIPDPVLLWRLSDGAIRYWNRAAAECYGYSATEVEGQNNHDFLKTEPWSAIAELENALFCDRKWSGELRRTAKSGVLLMIEARMAVLEWEHELCVLETNHDITSRRDTERALQFHFQLNKSITDQAVDPIFVIDSNGDIIFANPAAERVFGWMLEELVGQSFHRLLHHSHPDGSQFEPHTCPLLQAHVSGRTIRSMELVFFRKDKTPVPVSCSNSPLWFENGETGAVLIVRDITEQKRMEKALAESEERLRLAVQSSNIGTWDLNLLSGAVKVDEACRAALGLEKQGEQALNSWLRNVHPEDRRLTREGMKTALDPQGDGHFRLEFRTLSRADRAMRFVQVRGQAFFNETGHGKEPVRLVGTLQDITERKRAEEALLRANIDLQQFAYAAAHDLQEPLRNVVNLLGLYKRNLGGRLDEGADLVNASIEDAQRMHQMIRDLLSFADVHQLGEDPVTVIDSEPVLMEAIKNLSTLVQEAGAEVLNDPLPAIRIRPAHLLQLWQNLLSNALKYRNSQTKCFVKVSARRRGADWIFSVSDNGIGFDPAYAQRIFGIFKRLHGRFDYPGSGIGLAICARIVHTYGGRIWAEGELGHGATFFFSFPVVNHVR